jgi:hypothetical protein
MMRGWQKDNPLPGRSGRPGVNRVILNTLGVIMNDTRSKGKAQRVFQGEGG